MPTSYLEEHYGDIASVVGLLVTFVGFLVTIRNVRKAREAAEDARSASRQAVARISAQLIANETELSLQFMKQTESAIHERQWISARLRCVEARNWLARLLPNRNLQSDERTAINTACDDIGMIILELEKLCSNPELVKSPPRVGKKLHESIKIVTRIKARLDNRPLEV